MAHALWLKDFLIFLVAAGIVVPFFHRARVSAVLVFLAIGIVVGPLGLGRLAETFPLIRYVTIDQPDRVEPFAELGVIFLLFLLGLELSFERLWTLRRYVLGVGAAQVVVSAIAIGGIVYLLGVGGPAAVVLGLCLALSSTAVVMQVLAEQHRAGTQVGRVSLSVLLFQDIMVVPILFVAGILGTGGMERLALGLTIALVEAVAAIVVIVVAGRYVLRPLLRLAGRTGSRDLIMAITILIVIGVASATSAGGLSTALGAFLAGLLLGETEYRHQIEVDIEPFKGLLLGLFFMTVGMTIDPLMVVADFGWVVVATAALIALKAAILFGVSVVLGVAMSTAGEVALLLAQAGEFAFVVFVLSRASGLLDPATVQFATLVVGLSMVATPLLAYLGRRAGGRLQAVDHARHEPDAGLAELADHVIIGGFGRVGQTIAELLDQEGIPFVALDASGALVDAQRKAGRMVYFGDASRPEILARAGADRARAVVVTLDDAMVAENMVTTVMRRWPQAIVFARAKDTRHAARLARLGAVEVIPEAVEASLQLGGRLLEGLGLPPDVVAHKLARAREEESAKLSAAR